ncbi:hypothetical protein ACH5RR_001775 [Cinchona calisaya]|uniref:Ribosomal protein S14 n=1 Tax=Cinchona calisaya TaxID=153742 RepID=A0ABD3B4F8_9GENT
MALNQSGMGPIFMLMRNDQMGYTEMEKRQLFLRSYQFSRKKSMSERIKRSFFRVKRVIWVRLRSAKKIRKIVWSRLKFGFFFSFRRRRFFLRLHSNNNKYYYTSHNVPSSWPSSSSSCFW